MLWQLNSNHLMVLHRPLFKACSFEVVTRQSHDIADSETGVSHQQHHSACAPPLITSAPNLIASRDDLDDLLWGVGNNMVCLPKDRPFQASRRILGSPLPVSAELEELLQKFDFLDPSPAAFGSPQRVSIHRFDVDAIPKMDRLLVAELEEVIQYSLVLALCLNSMAVMQPVECIYGIDHSFPGLPEIRSSISVSRLAASCRSRVFREIRTLLPSDVPPTRIGH